MAKTNLKWQPDDALLLEALLLATGGEGGTSLQDVLLMVDAIEGTVLAFDQLNQGLEKLVSVEYVSVQKNKLFLSSGFLEDYIKESKAATMEDERELLLKLLQDKALTSDRIEEVRDSVFKKYKLKNYYQQYLEQFG